MIAPSRTNVLKLDKWVNSLMYGSMIFKREKNVKKSIQYETSTVTDVGWEMTYISPPNIF